MKVNQKDTKYMFLLDTLKIYSWNTLDKQKTVNT